MKIKSDRFLPGLFILSLLGFLTILYLPTFHHVSYFDGSQLEYHFERHDITSFSEGLKFYDFFLTRNYIKANEILFRPVFFLWFAFILPIVKYNFYAWNIINFSFHLSATSLLYVLLRLIKKDRLAFWTAFLFSTFAIGYHSVIDAHLTGYMIAYNFFLLLLIVSRKLTTSFPWTNSLHLTYFLGGLMAVFSYEVMPLASLVVGIFVIAEMRFLDRKFSWRECVFLFSPSLIYSLVYAFRLGYVPRFAYAPRSDGSYCLAACGNWLSLIACPLDTFRLRIREIMLFNISGRVIPFFALKTIFAGASFLFLIKKSIVREHWIKEKRWLLSIMLILFLYLVIGCIGRGYNTQSYYNYFFALLAVILGYSCFDWSKLTFSVKIFTIVILGFLIFYQLMILSAHIKSARRVSEERYYSFLSDFVKAYAREPGFSFRIENPDSINDAPFSFIQGYEDNRTAMIKEVRASEIIYSKYYRKESPQYCLTWRPDRFSFDSPVCA